MSRLERTAFSAGAAGTGCAAGLAVAAGLPVPAVICFGVMAAGFVILSALAR